MKTLTFFYEKYNLVIWQQMFGSIFHHELVETQIKLFASNEKGPNESTGQVQSIGIKIIVKIIFWFWLAWYTIENSKNFIVSHRYYGAISNTEKYIKFILFFY